MRPDSIKFLDIGQSLLIRFLGTIDGTHLVRQCAVSVRRTVSGYALRAEIALAFSAAGVKQAILGAQRGEVMYPEFKKLSQAAGCIGYIVWLSGKHVVYFGRNGETHVEHFPK